MSNITPIRKAEPDKLSRKKRISRGVGVAIWMKEPFAVLFVANESRLLPAHRIFPSYEGGPQGAA